MVHPTPILIPPLLSILPRFPPIQYCHVTQKFRALSATEEGRLLDGTVKANIVREGNEDEPGSKSTSSSMPHAGHSLSANSYPLPPSIINASSQSVSVSVSSSQLQSQSLSQGQGQGGQRQKQLNNTTPLPPPVPAGVETAVKDKAPPPTIFWNDHLRML